MYKRFINLGLVAFWLGAVALGAWGFADTGSGFSPTDPGSESPPDTPASDYSSSVHSMHTLTWKGGVHCVVSSVALIRLYDVYQPFRDPWQLVWAQVLVPGIALFSAARLFLIGVRKNIRNVMARHKTNHTIVCGIGDVGMQVILNLRTAGHHIVAVDLRDDSPSAATCEQSGVPVLQGDAKNPEVLLAAGIRHARTAVVSTGSDSENMDIALQIQSMHTRSKYFRPGKIQVLAELRNDWMHKRLIASDKSSMGAENVDFHLFNPFTDAARMLIKRLHLPPNPEFEARTFALVGFGAYGREIALHLIRLSPVALDATLKIIVFDEKADKASERFSITHPAAIAMASLEFINASIAPGSPDLGRVVEPTFASAGSILGVALALGDDETSLCAALELRSLLDRSGFLHVPIYVRLEHYRQLGDLVREIEGISRFGDRLQIFGTLEETLSPDVLFGSSLDRFAQALHEDYCRRSQSTINQQASVAWHELPEFMKMSNRWRADHTPMLMELAGIHVVRDVASPEILELSAEQVEVLAKLEHRRYTMERSLVETRFGSPQGKKTHMRDWSELTDEEKEANRKEVAQLPKLMAELGMELHPVRAIHLYGNGLADAAKELEKVSAAPGPAHCSLIVDLDDPEAVRIAAGALAEPSLSLWLFSREEPREFALRKPPTQQTDRGAVIRRANGWTFRDRLALEN